MTKIAVKSGIKQLPSFENSLFEYYEAYTHFHNDLNQLLDTQMKLINIHLSNTVPLNNLYYPLNFNQDAIGYQQSLYILNKVVNFCELHCIPNIVIHLGFFNRFIENRWKILDDIAKIFNKYSSSNVRLCIENIPRWFNNLDNEPLISNDVHMNYFISKFPSGGIVFDIDHVVIDTVYGLKINNYKIDEKFIDDKIENFIQNIDPDIIHTMGTDYTNLFTSNEYPLIGEALPLKFNGIINGHNVKDRTNHEKWIPLISNKKEKIFVLELMMRPNDYDLVDTLKLDMNILKNWLDK